LVCKPNHHKYNERFGTDGIHNPLTWADAEVNEETLR